MRHLDMQRDQQRSGLSLVEVLISIFILAVGVLSIASLLPLGQNQVALAETQERATQAGLNAFKTFVTRGFSNYQWWQTATGTSVANSPNPSAVLNQPIIIDPLLISSTTNTAIQAFPHNTGFTPPPTNLKTLIRYTVKTQPSNANGTKLPRAVAEGIFVSRDDKILNDRAQPEDAATFLMNGGIIDYEGRFSWFAMLAPAYPGYKIPNSVEGRPNPGFPCELTVVVMDRRSLDVLTDDVTVAGQKIPRERGVSVTDFDNSDIGGGEITIGVDMNTKWAQLLIKPGEYLMLLSQDQKYARWYRIVGADELKENQTSREITISGPDWGWSKTGVTAVLVDGAVGVYTKSIKLEGPSPWN
jgi:type II secretory pathway pseudopilin PulG